MILRPSCRLPLRLGLATVLLCAFAPVHARDTITPKDAASCPQFQYLSELPPVSDDPALILDADHADVRQLGISHLSGSVHLSQNGRAFAADQVDYDEATQHIHINAESFFRDARLVLKSEHSDFDLTAQTGEFFDAHFTLVSLNGRGTAERIFVTHSDTAELEHVTYTSCAPDNQAWLLSASRLQFDQAKGVGQAHNATLRFEDVPILYLPYFRFPIDNERHSGFLAPVVGESNNRGFDIRAPLYLNLAPNYDATLIPRYMSHRGEQIGADARYLFTNTAGSLQAEYLPNDQQTGQERSYINFSHQELINHRLALEAHVANVSDRDYFSDFGGNFDLSSTSYLARGASITYQAPASYTIEALVQNYQPISTELTNDDNAYTRLPQIRLDALTRNAFLSTRAGFDGEYTNFVRSNSVQGSRFIAQPYLRWEQDHNAWYASAQADVSYTAYGLTGVAPDQSDEPRRVLPIYDAEAGLRFVRSTDNGGVQTLEPHIQYLLVPYRDQDNLPIFDSGQPDFDFPQLFALNRYSGEDRIADTDQITTAATTRVIDPNTGFVRLTASLGEAYEFRAPRVGLPVVPFSNTGTGSELPPVPLPSTGSSDYVGEMKYQINKRWETDAAAEWTPGFDRFQRTALAVRYREPDKGVYGQRFDLDYRYRQGLLEQTDASFSTPINGSLRVAARLEYSVRDHSALESFLGLEYQTCCWAMRTTYRRYLSSSNGDFSNGVYFQLELKGLTRIGNGFDSLLPAIDPDAPIRGSNATKVIP